MRIDKPVLKNQYCFVSIETDISISEQGDLFIYHSGPDRKNFSVWAKTKNTYCVVSCGICCLVNILTVFVDDQLCMQLEEEIDAEKRRIEEEEKKKVMSKKKKKRGLKQLVKSCVIGNIPGES